ncbi:MAG: nicotinate-nucleotide adenylyltransferase [Anaerolineae bacterium]|nr:nicotinate-nucleotide adenylyltransferase [Thermoflexus sp.]MDW8064376.1 nicotinate-nucleotide adenylyltransferase [Anaerolineae bacterium]
MNRLGLLGGTFDPPHYGHLVLAEQARIQLDLDRVLFIPAAQPPHKPATEVTPIQHRLNMLARAIAGNPFFELSRADIDRPGPHYTVDLLAQLQIAYPDVEFFFLMGSDSLVDLPRWREPYRLIQMAWLAVMPRPGYAVHMLLLEQALPGISKRLIWLDAPFLDISSQDLRRRVGSGGSIRYLVPPDVEIYIYTHGLYRNSTASTREKP